MIDDSGQMVFLDKSEIARNGFKMSNDIMLIWKNKSLK